MRTNTKNENIEMIREKVRRIKSYYTHLSIFGIVLVLYVFKTYFGLSFSFFPLKWLNHFVISCWAFVIFIKTLKIFFAHIFFNENWERNKINEIIEKENQFKNHWE
ncbi:2TM domain-containing protein [Flavobacterium oreochromis]|uniref:2TM domain-containing protein n=2 Tax=Flavobacterium TaxID=237 RepID=A0A246G8Z5_9FLAO|nr:2TM domain-containing protein [Flavobacterium oreochromis]OWP75139.1 hypothetical protein BWG23_11765 [Flavobacterium oreochromis]OWP75751.1 hypothetical protein BWK62_11340 [Flavobacterium oreochromis]QYS86085.1 2TM domain-containing protein [Flavobacterium oreochromis]